MTGGANENYTGFLYQYDDVGNVTSYSQDRYDYGGLVITNKYLEFDDYKLQEIKGERNNATPGITTNTYDTNGHLIQVDDSTQSTNRRSFGVDGAGHVLKKVEGNASVTHSWLVNDQVIGSGVSAVDKADGLTYDFEQAEYTVKPNDTFETIAYARWGDTRLGSLIARANGMKVSDSLSAVIKLTIPAREDSINTSYQTLQSGSSAQSMYVVKSADETFESIAKMQWGDSSLWYLIADANRMGATDGLTQGQLLIIPAKGAATHNNINSFKPYSPNEAIGDLTPNLPMPQGQDEGCGTMGMIIVAIVVVIAIVLSEGALAEAAPEVFGTAGGSTAVVTVPVVGGGTVGVSAAGVIAGSAIGSVAGQLAGNALGVHHGFSWKEVGLSALGGAVTAGVGVAATNAGVDSALFGDGFTAVTGRAMISNALTQGIAVKTGLTDTPFSWKGVAAAGVGAGVGQQVGAAMGGANSTMFNDTFGGTFGGSVARGTISGFAAGLSVAAMRGGRINATQIAADAFGNALGSSLASANSNLDLSDPANRDAKGQELLDRVNKLRADNGLSVFDRNDTEAAGRFNKILDGYYSDKTSTRINAYGDLLAVGGVDSGSVDETVDRLTSSYRNKSFGYTVGQAEAPGPEAAFGSTVVDSFMQGTGDLVKKFGGVIENNPIAKYSLMGLDFAGGPALYLARTALTKFTPVGDLVEEAQQKAVGTIAGRMESTGYGKDTAIDGGVGGLTLISLAAGGVGATIGRLQAVENIVSSMRSTVSRTYSELKTAAKLTNWVGPLSPNYASLSAASVSRSVFERLRLPFEKIATVPTGVRQFVLENTPRLPSGELAYMNPLTNTLTAFKEGEKIAIDHIVPVNKMLDPSIIPGVNKLTRQEMEMLIHDEMELGNHVAMPSGFNSSKQDKLGNWTEYKGQPLNGAYAANLAATQRDILSQMKDWVANQTRGR